MKTKQTANTILYLVTVLLSVLLIYFGNRYVTRGEWFESRRNLDAPVRAEVVQVVDRKADEYSLDGDNKVENQEVVFEARILAGEKRGTLVRANQVTDSFSSGAAKEVERGDKVLLYAVDSSIYGEAWSFAEYIRTDAMLVLCGVFFLLLLIFGRRQGFSTIVSLTFTALSVFAVFVPSILAGYNIYVTSLAVALYIIVMTLAIVSGYNRKSLVAAIGCASGVLVAGGLGFLMDRIIGLTGVLDESSVYLQFVAEGTTIDLRAIIFAGITLGALGAVMDVAMSIASAIYEIRLVSEKPTVRGLIQSGFTIGRDIMGTMANTLVLAYIGSSLSVVVLMVAYNSSLLALFNKEMIVVELLQMLTGSIGILCTIPLTSIVAALIYLGRRKKHEQPTDPSGA